MFDSGDSVKWDPVAWETVVPPDLWASEESEEDHLTFRGALLLTSLTDLPQERKPDRIRPVCPSDLAPCTVFISKAQARKENTTLYIAFDSDSELKSLVVGLVCVELPTFKEFLSSI